MNVEIKKSTVWGSIQAPPSKSYGHRMLICAALSDGPSRVQGISASEDMLATCDCIRAFGVEVNKQEEECSLGGLATRTKVDSLPEYKCRESGSTLRFFIPIAMALSGGGIFKGAERLIERGIGIYEEIFTPMGVNIEKGLDYIKIEGELQSFDYKVRGNVSSQFISGLLFALPLCKGDSTIEILPPVESRAYIDITIDSMKLFGIDIQETAPNHFFIKGGQKYEAKDTRVEGDWSNAAFLYAIRHLAAENGNLDILGLKENSVQGDRVCVEYLEKLAAGTKEVLDLSNCPDLGPILFAFAAACHGGSFTGISRLRIKESDRAKVMEEELERFGVKCIVMENDMVVPDVPLKAPNSICQGHNDHRIVMSLAVLMLLTGGEIQGAEAVRKSYPDFFTVLQALGVEIYYK